MYDWAHDIAEAIDAGKHDALFVLLGANDAQPLQFADAAGTAEFGTDEWIAEYRLRVAALMAQADYARVRLVWIGLPPARSTPLDVKLSVISAAVASEASVHPYVTYIDLRSVLAPEHKYQAHCTWPDGTEFPCRTNDGVHFNTAGYDFVATLAIETARGQGTNAPSAP